MFGMDASARRGRWLDVGLVGLVAGLVLLGSAHIETEPGARSIDALAVACGLVGAGALALWRRLPLAMVAAVAGVIFTYLARDYPGGPSLLPGPLSLLLLGWVAPRRLAWSGAGVMATAVLAGEVVGDGQIGGIAIAGVGWSLAAVLAGQAVSARAERVVAERERQTMRERQAVTDERLRIAQDLHDTVAHAMATINVQAGVAAHLLEQRPDRIRPEAVGDALHAIRGASAQVLDELGAILGVLRDGDDPAAPRAPVVTVDRIDELVERARADGLEVTCAVEGELRTVSPTISTAGYRVVQEALSNARRHAGPRTSVKLSVRVDGPDRVEVAVDDDGGRPGRPNGTPGVGAVGLGLLGMRERVESSGGELQVGPNARGGFRVSARWQGR